MSLPDLAYVVRPGDNQELRYSLRSVAENAPEFGKIWIVGSVPDWVTGVESLALSPAAEKFANIRQSVHAIANNDEIADNVIIFNDDHFLIDPVDEWRSYHMGTVTEYLAKLAKKGTTPRSNTWCRAVKETGDWLQSQGFGDVLTFETHTPVQFDRAMLAHVLDEMPADKGIYIDLFAAAGTGPTQKSGNSKVSGTDLASLEAKLNQDLPYLSSNDKSFENGVVGGFIRGCFRKPCRFEA